MLRALPGLLLAALAACTSAPVSDAVSTPPDFVSDVTVLAGKGAENRREPWMRQGKMILARLELGLASAQTHPSPLGPRPRSADDVRRAMQALSDPRRRLAAEPFALAATMAPASPPPGDIPDSGAVGADAAVVDVAALLWWRP